MTYLLPQPDRDAQLAVQGEGARQGELSGGCGRGGLPALLLLLVRQYLERVGRKPLPPALKRHDAALDDALVLLAVPREELLRGRAGGVRGCLCGALPRAPDPTQHTHTFFSTQSACAVPSWAPSGAGYASKTQPNVPQPAERGGEGEQRGNMGTSKLRAKTRLLPASVRLSPRPSNERRLDKARTQEWTAPIPRWPKPRVDRHLGSGREAGEAHSALCGRDASASPSARCTQEGEYLLLVDAVVLARWCMYLCITSTERRAWLLRVWRAIVLSRGQFNTPVGRRTRILRNAPAQTHRSHAMPARAADCRCVCGGPGV